MNFIKQEILSTVGAISLAFAGLIAWVTFDNPGPSQDDNVRFSFIAVPVLLVISFFSWRGYFAVDLATHSHPSQDSSAADADDGEMVVESPPGDAIQPAPSRHITRDS